jgi:hypothetical protein
VGVNFIQFTHCGLSSGNDAMTEYCSPTLSSQIIAHLLGYACTSKLYQMWISLLLCEEEILFRCML